MFADSPKKFTSNKIPFVVMNARLILLVLLCCMMAGVQAQSKKNKSGKSNALFTVAGKPVLADEFIYLYNKNHQSKPEEYTRESIEEYLRLFINFKLKVEEAKRRGMDTTASFISEFTSYRNELLKPYLSEDKIVDSLVNLTYQHLQEELRASHILAEVKPDASPEDTLKAYNRIQELKKRIEGGEDFGAVAIASSDDPSARTNKGDLGYFTALQMVYPFEAAAYKAKVDAVVGPVRTQFGYHLIQVTDRKPSRGEVEVAHIMIRTQSQEDDQRARNTIFNVYDQLNAGASWEEMCTQYSEDQSSKQNGGKLRPFGVRAMASVPEFEAAAFSLERPGQLSDPVKTAYGWHILRLVRKSPVPPLEEISAQLKGKVMRDDRLAISKEARQAKLRQAYSYQENDKVLASVKHRFDSLLSGDATSEKTGHEILFKLKDKGFSVYDFIRHVRKGEKQKAKNTSFEKLYDEFVDAQLMNLMEEKIAKSNPEFQMLVREYYEGILLFEIMEKEVWDKASADSAGQQTFFEANRTRYQAGQRVRAGLYYSSKDDFIEPLKKLIEAGDSTIILQFLASHDVKHEQGSYEKGDKPMLDKIQWAAGLYSLENNGMYYLVHVTDIRPPGPKTFDEARASVIADYQQHLENEWVSQLRKKYPINVNEKVRKSVLETLEK